MNYELKLETNYSKPSSSDTATAATAGAETKLAGRCHNCNQPGHFAKDCPQKQATPRGRQPNKINFFTSPTSHGYYRFQPGAEQLPLPPPPPKDADALADAQDKPIYEPMRIGLLCSAALRDDETEFAMAATDYLVAAILPEERRPGRPKIYSDDSVEKIRVSQSLADRLRLDDALRTNMLLKCLQIALTEAGEEEMHRQVQEAMTVVTKRQAQLARD